MSDLWDKAITRDSSPILIIRGSDVVGKARWCSAFEGWTAMRITEGEALAWVEDMAEKHGDGVMKASYFNPRYYDLSGVYAPKGDEKGWGFLDDAFGETRAVSEFGLEYGLVPDSFKDVKGYRSKLDALAASSDVSEEERARRSPMW